MMTCAALILSACLSCCLWDGGLRRPPRPAAVLLTRDPACGPAAEDVPAAAAWHAPLPPPAAAAGPAELDCAAGC